MLRATAATAVTPTNGVDREEHLAAGTGADHQRKNAGQRQGRRSEGAEDQVACRPAAHAAVAQGYGAVFGSSPGSCRAPTRSLKRSTFIFCMYSASPVQLLLGVAGSTNSAVPIATALAPARMNSPASCQYCTPPIPTI